MFIQVEETPNPLSLKFITNSEIIATGHNVVFNQNGNLDDAPPFIKDIFEIENITNVMISNQFITVSVAESSMWNIVKPEIIHILLDYAQRGNLSVQEQSDEKKSAKEFVGIEKEIYDLIEERVRPAVEMDGGDIEFIRFDQEQGIVYVKMKGSCSGCPSSSATLKGGIQRMLEYYVPEVTDVVPVED